MRFVPDVLRVSYGTSQELRSLILTQLRNMGTKTWLDEFPAGHLAVFVLVGDDGPDVGGGPSA